MRVLALSLVYLIYLSIPALSQMSISNSASNKDAEIRSFDTSFVITDAGMSYCPAGKTCSYTKALYLGKSPFQFLLFFANNGASKGTSFDGEISIIKSNNDIVYKMPFVGSVQFESQQTKFSWDTQPAELASLDPGNYKLKISIINDDFTIEHERFFDIIAIKNQTIAGKPSLSNAFGECVTMETGSDYVEGGSFLECAMRAAPGMMRHSSTEEAFRNLATCSGPDLSYAIVGHGHAGFICTGEGNNCPNNFISDYNGINWFKHARSIKNQAREIRLIGCSTGAGTSGLTLLQKMSKIVNARALAPTDLVICYNDSRGIQFPQWRSVSPNGMTEIAGDIVNNEISTAQVAKIMVENSFMSIDRLTIVPISFQPSKNNERHSQPFSAASILDHANFSEPLITEGIFSATYDGLLTVQITLPSSEKKIKQFNLLGDRLLQDTAYGNVYYNVRGLIN